TPVSGEVDGESVAAPGTPRDEPGDFPMEPCMGWVGTEASGGSGVGGVSEGSGSGMSGVGTAEGTGVAQGTREQGSTVGDGDGCRGFGVSCHGVGRSVSGVDVGREAGLGWEVGGGGVGSPGASEARGTTTERSASSGHICRSLPGAGSVRTAIRRGSGRCRAVPVAEDTPGVGRARVVPPVGTGSTSCR